MAWQSPDDPCELDCLKKGTDLCLRHLLTDEGIADHRLSLGVLCGLKHVYHPGELPPCVQHNGGINWHEVEV